MKEEYFDILDDNGEKTGEVRERGEVHRLGLKHRTVHVWVISEHKRVLIQQRSHTVRNHPNLWDISAAGHIAAGDRSVDAAQRELREELNIKLPIEEFGFLSTVRQHAKTDNRSIIDDEFQDVYMVRLADETLAAPDRDEVEQVRWLTFDEFEAWTQGKGEPMVNHEEEYALVASFLRSLP